MVPESLESTGREHIVEQAWENFFISIKHLNSVRFLLQGTSMNLSVFSSLQNLSSLRVLEICGYNSIESYTWNLDNILTVIQGCHVLEKLHLCKVDLRGYGPDNGPQSSSSIVNLWKQSFLTGGYTSDNAGIEFKAKPHSLKSLSICTTSLSSSSVVVSLFRSFPYLQELELINCDNHLTTSTVVQILTTCRLLSSLTLRYHSSYACTLEFQELSTAFTSSLRSLTLLNIDFKNVNFVQMDPTSIQGIERLMALDVTSRCPTDVVEFIMTQFSSLLWLEIGAVIPFSTYDIPPPAVTAYRTCCANLEHLDICNLPLGLCESYAIKFFSRLGPEQMPQLTSLRIDLQELRLLNGPLMVEKVRLPQLRVLFVQGTCLPRKRRAYMTEAVGDWLKPINAEELQTLHRMLNPEAKLIYCHFGEHRVLPRK
ncbi:hypothetical protein BGZ50_001837 [Haplosporangium sp. Z 11]|nr:hypothetical protein BGZ50_001837 [Haplosporangium sp. Z 11]